MEKAFRHESADLPAILIDLYRTRLVSVHSDLPLLTIAIPTYNRSRTLVRLLASLAPQLAGEDRVELFISDNDSSDETDSALRQQRLSGLVFRSTRNSVNIGADANFVQCFEQARGRYVWIIGDDDVIAPGALRLVLNLLSGGLARGEPFDIVNLQDRTFEGDGHILEISQSPAIKIIEDAQAFALRTHVRLTFITGNVIYKDRVESLPHPPFSSLIGTNLAQLGWTYTALRHFRRGACVLEPLIAAGADDRGGYELYNVFGTNLQRITEEWLVDTRLIRVVTNGTLQTFFPAFVFRSAGRVGVFAGQAPDALLHSLFSGNYRYYLFLYPLMKLPRGLARGWLLLCRIINRLNKALGSPMLR